MLLRFCGFFEAVADGEAQACVIGNRAEDGGHSASIEVAQAGEEGLGEGGVVVEGVPVEEFYVAVMDGPVLREHDADFFFISDQVNEAVVEFGFGVDEDDAGAGGVVAYAYSGGG